jgi:L-fuconolactonase
MRVDSHQHFWKVSRGDYYWMTPTVSVLYRDYLPEDLEPLLRRHQIARTVLVQAAPTVAETDFLLDIAHEHDFVAGVVGWLDLEADDFPNDFERYCRNPKFIGIRPMVQDLPDEDWLVRPRVIESLRLIAERGFPFDFLTFTRHLPYALRVLEKVPKLRAVVDHISKPEIKAKRQEPWASLIKEVAQHEKVCCKLSGMVTEADHRNWTPDDLRPYVEHVVQCFGLERVMFGSDWPVCLMAGSYDRVLGALATILKPHLTESSERAVFGGNAARFYAID